MFLIFDILTFLSQMKQNYVQSILVSEQNDKSIDFIIYKYSSKCFNFQLFSLL